MVDSIHYRSLRLIIKDYKQRVPREWVSASTQRLPPGEWAAKFSAVSLAMKVRNSQQSCFKKFLKTLTHRFENLADYLDMTCQRPFLDVLKLKIG